MNEISGLVVKSLVRHVDERGDFREILRRTDPGFVAFSQLSASVVFEGVAKAWHLHHKQTESMTALAGIVKFAFADRRENSKTFGRVKDFLVDASASPLVFTVPPGVAHGYRIVHGPAIVVYLASELYDPADQLKIAHDSADIAYDWGPPRIT